MRGPKRKYTSEQLEAKINEYFETTDANPIYKWEQRKGNIVIPKDFTGEIKQIDNLVGIPIPKIYLEQEICYFLDYDKEWLADNQKIITERLKDKSHYKNQEEEDEDVKTLRIITRAREKCRTQKLQGAAAGIFNPVIISRIEGLKDQTEVTQTTISADNKTEDEIRAAIKAIEQARNK